jgi:glycoside/pentoside/hexuronide:cation symporter, GPH family
MDPRSPPLRTKLLYASSSLGSEALSQSRGLWILYAYSPPRSSGVHAILPLGLAGLVLSIDGVVGAFYYPIISYLTDRTRSRLGRRLPYIVVATPLWTLFAVLVFAPPRDAGTTSIAVYLIVTLELGSIFATLSGAAYQALLPEIARSSADRMSVIALRTYFGAVGGGVGLVGASVLVDAAGVRVMAVVMAIVALTTRYAGTAGVWRRASRTQPPAMIGFRAALRATFANGQFVFLLPSIVLFQAGVALILAGLPFDVKAIVHASHPGTWVAVFTALAITSMVGSIPFVARRARRATKQATYRRAMLGAAFTFPLLAVVGVVPGIPAALQIAVVMVIAGPQLAGYYLFPDALTADVIDDEERRSSMRREAMFYGSANFVSQVVGSLVPLFLSLLLLLGDTSRHQLGLRLVGPAASGLVLLGYLAFRSYNLPDDAASQPTVDTPRG